MFTYLRTFVLFGLFFTVGSTAVYTIEADDKEDARSFLLSGGAKYKHGDYNEAIVDLSEAIRLDPKLALAYCVRGVAWYRIEELDKAIADLDEAIRLDPSNAVAFVDRGMVRNRKRDHDGAITDLDEAIRLRPRFAVAFTTRGCVWIIKGKNDKAISDLSEAIRLDPDDALAFYNRGGTWLKMKDYDRGIADLDKAISLDPTSADITCPGEKYRNGQKAVESATAACKMTGWKDAEYLDTLAAAFAEAGDFEKAIEYQEKANAIFKSGEDKKRGEERLSLYRDKPYRDAGDRPVILQDVMILPSAGCRWWLVHQCFERPRRHSRTSRPPSPTADRRISTEQGAGREKEPRGGTDPSPGQCSEASR
jgi:tetratricopeptide (TPR) repeat protein